MITTHHVFLALTAIALLGVIAAQDYLYAPLRSESISAGLTGPYHWWLDASYLLLAIALIKAAPGHSTLTGFCAVVAAVALLLTAVTNTFGTWVDRFTGGQHALWHTRFTAIVFLAALGLEVSASHGSTLWTITGLSVIVPAAVRLISKRADYTEKAGVTWICIWLVVWTL